MADIERSAADLLKGNPYPGRGILVGRTADGTRAFLAYFIMGRSENSRNRLLVEQEGALYTRPFDEAKVTDPSLIIYPAMRRLGQEIILTNGDQTDTILQARARGEDLFTALESRTYEPDQPNYTPRISAILSLKKGDLTYDMSILRRRAGSDDCERARFSFSSKAGVGHLIHTYLTDGDPLPSYEGAPKEVALGEDLDEMASVLWDALDEGNRIALFVRTIDLRTGAEETRLFNKHTRSE